MAEVTINNLSYIYSRGTPFEKKAIDDLTMSIPAGQFVGIIGHTGSGKSTLIKHLNALMMPSSGEILLDGVNINGDKKSRRDSRRKVGLVFQYPEYQLFEETVYKDIAFGPKNMGLSDAEVDERIREAAGFTGVDESLFESSPLELSGGQKRRVAIAGVIAMRPEVLVLDEPTAGLDPEGCRQLLGNIEGYRRASGATVVIVSHSMDDVARIAERLIVMNAGHIAFDGTPAEVFAHSRELEEMGLTVPAATKIALSLKQKGIEIDTAVYTHEQLLAAIMKAKEGTVC